MKSVKKDAEIWEDKWISTACGGCYAACSIRVHRINGVAVEITGNPDSSLGARGGLCGKGVAGLMMLYDPNRLNVPLRRTNPEKGIGVDPKWKEISWEEALDEIAEKMQKIRDDNPHKLWVNMLTNHAYGWTTMGLTFWNRAFGSHQELRSGGSIHCGNAAHQVAGLIHGSWSVVPDWKYNQYAIKWGSSKGTGSGHSMTTNARLRADAMDRPKGGGVKEVCFDPMCNFAGGKSTEWVPILPGTDSAVALAMCNYIVNELNIFDAEYFKKKTNLPFLVGPDGSFVRDKENDDPMVWDSVEGVAKTYFDQSIKDVALEGEFDVAGMKVRPAFVPLREHLKKQSLEEASKISTVPVETIKRIATEFAENARIGSTITIEGKSYPFRPVASVLFRGAQGHTNGVHQCAAVDLLNEIVGAVDVPGGCLGWPTMQQGYTDNFSMVPRAGKDGIIIPALFFGAHDPWPIPLPEKSQLGGRCHEFWPMATVASITSISDQEEIWDKLDMTVKPEMMLSFGSNYLVAVANWEDAFEIAEKIPFIVQVDIFSTETGEALADILLPDVCYLERLDWSTNVMSYFFNHAPTLDEWTHQAQVPVLDKIPGERRDCMDVCFDLAYRLGFLDNYLMALNAVFRIEDPDLKFKPGEKLAWNEAGDRVLKWVFGKDHGIEFFKENGTLKWPKQVDEVYWRWGFEGLKDVKVPVYMEYMIKQGEASKKLCEEVGIEQEFEQYTPLVTYFPTISIRELDDVYDLFAFSYRDILHTNSQTPENAWLDEASDMCPYTYNITLNTQTANERGLKDGDKIVLETQQGHTETGMLKTLEGQHPKTVAIAGQSGLFAKGRPLSVGKGCNFDRLLPCDLKHFDPITLTIETAVPVKIYKEKGESR